MRSRLRIDCVTLLGPRYIDHLRRFIGEDLNASGWLAAQDSVSRAVLNALRFNWHPRLRRMQHYSDGQMAVSAPLVQAGELEGVARSRRTTFSALLTRSTATGHRDQFTARYAGARNVAAHGAASFRTARVHAPPPREQ
jgi:hypothetical protein